MGGRDVVVDMDDVLVNICQKWAAKATLDPALAGLPTVAALAGLDPAGLGAAVRGRDRHWLQEWLGIMGRPMLRDAFDALYRGDPAFYDGLPPTPFALGLLAARRLENVVGELHVVTHTMGDGDPCNASKRRWLERWLGPERPGVRFHLLDGGKRKSELIAAVCPEPSLFADDSLKNVADVLGNEASRPRQILVPAMGCNSPFPEAVAVLARARRIELSHYLAVHSPEEDLPAAA